MPRLRPVFAIAVGNEALLWFIWSDEANQMNETDQTNQMNLRY